MACSTLCLLLVVLCYTLANGGVQSYFAMCLIVKDDLDNLPEWVEYHRRMGASKFYIFDHNSSTPLVNGIANYVVSGLVDYILTDFHWTKQRPQIGAYNECLKRYGQLHRFIAFTDADEFIVVVDKTKRIPDVLKDYEKYGGVALNWMMFGSSGHVEKPPGGVIANYYKCSKNKHVKVIANTKYTERSSGNPHHFVYTHDHPYFFYTHEYVAVSANRERTPVHGPFQPDLTTAFDIMYINHYNTRSKSEFLNKMARGRGAMQVANTYSVAQFEAVDRSCNETCPILQMPPETGPR